MVQRILQKTSAAALVLTLSAASAFFLTLPTTSAWAINLWNEPIDGAPVRSYGGVRGNPDSVPRDSQQVTYNWKKAREYQEARRYELARQHFLMALSACRTEETRDRLQRELQIVELQLRTLR